MALLFPFGAGFRFNDVLRQCHSAIYFQPCPQLWLYAGLARPSIMPPLRTTALLLASFAGRALAQNITYDYVIAGAGTAGMLLGVVLSENPAINVVVLEAGSDGRTDQNITNPQLRGKIDTPKN